MTHCVDVSMPAFAPLLTERLSYVAGGVSMLRRFETAVTNCAGAKGFDMRILLGTPCEAH
jgi:hypothetical protein